MIDLLRAKSLLYSDNYTCVLCRGDVTYTSSCRGIKPLREWFEGGYNLLGFTAADKVVGKASAFIYVLMEVKAVYAHVIGRAALEVLTYYGITVEYDELVDNIRNRRGDGICPFEEAVLDVDVTAPHIAYKVICEKFRKMNLE